MGPRGPAIPGHPSPRPFVIRYSQLQDYDVATWDNTATVTLEASGKITVQHGTVLSQDMAVDVFDGSHTDDRFVSVQE